MNKFNIPLVAEGLTAYAIERQNGWERHRPEGAPPLVGAPALLDRRHPPRYEQAGGAINRSRADAAI